MTDTVKFHFSFLNGKGNGTLLQYSCLENSMDGGAWQAAVHGVAKGLTRLSDFTFTFHFHALEKDMVFLPGESQGRGSLVGCHLWGHTELDTTEVTQQQQSYISILLFQFIPPSLSLGPRFFAKLNKNLKVLMKKFSAL